MPKGTNHDQHKVAYANKTRALEEVQRIRQENGGGKGTERLNIYYDRERGGWLVGKLPKRGFYN